MFYVVIELFIIQKCKNQGRDNNFYEALTNPQIYHIHKPHIHKDLKKYFGQKSTSTIRQLVHILTCEGIVVTYYYQQSLSSLTN